MFSCRICDGPCTGLLCDDCKKSKNQHIVQRREAVLQDRNAKPQKLAKVVNWVLSKFENNDD